MDKRAFSKQLYRIILEIEKLASQRRQRGDDRPQAKGIRCWPTETGFSFVVDFATGGHSAIEHTPAATLSEIKQTARNVAKIPTETNLILLDEKPADVRGETRKQYTKSQTTKIERAVLTDKEMKILSNFVLAVRDAITEVTDEIGDDPDEFPVGELSLKLAEFIDSEIKSFALKQEALRILENVQKQFNRVNLGAPAPFKFPKLKGEVHYPGISKEICSFIASEVEGVIRGLDWGTEIEPEYIEKTIKETISEGDPVRHSKFGEGFVQKIIEGETPTAIVSFAAFGAKKIALNFLEKI